MQRSLIILNLVILLVIVNLGYIVEAKEIHVPKDYRTIQEAVNAAISGDTVMVAAGVYEESIKLKDGVNLVGAGAPVTIIKGNGEAVIDALDARQPSRIEGFTIDAQRCNYGIKSQMLLVIISNIITGARGSGIYNSGFLRGNKIFHNKDCGINITAADLGTESEPGLNEIYDNSSHNIRRWGSDVIKAELNWWGQEPPDSGKFSGGGIDYEPWLPTQPLSVNNGAYSTNDATVTLTLPAHTWMGEGAQMRFSNDGQTWSDPEPHAKTKSWTLPVGDGMKTVYAGVKTAKGEWVTLFDSIFLDTIPPTGTITINVGRVETTSQLVVLTLTMQDAGSGAGPGARMQFSNDNKTWPNPEPWASSKIWKLPEKPGEYTVYAKFCDAAGNWIDVPISDTIRLIEPKKGDVYVDDDGSDDTGDGSLDNPWRTITFALSQVDSPGTIYVAPGIYDPTSGEKFPLKMKNGVSLVGTAAEVTILDAQETGTVIECRAITNPATRIEGFTIRNGNRWAEHSAGGIFISGGSLLTIENNIIAHNEAGSNYSSGGIYIADSSPVIRDNNITDNWVQTSSGGAIFIFGSTSSPQIIGNRMLRNYHRGGAIYVGEGTSPLITNNILAHNGGPDWEEGSGTIFLAIGTLPKIINNTIANNNTHGIRLEYNSCEPIILNNTISNNSRYGIYEASSTSDGPALTVKYNLFYENKDGVYYDEGKYKYETVAKMDKEIVNCHNNLEGNPLFVDVANGDYHLQPDSSAIDAGNPTSDYSKEPEPNGFRINIGAYGNTPEATRTSGIPDIELSEIEHDFGSVKVGDSREFTLTVSNQGDGYLWVEFSSKSTHFAVFPTFLRVPAHANMQVAIQFTPRSVSSKIGKLDIISNDPNQQRLEFKVEGLGESPIPPPPMYTAWPMYGYNPQHTSQSPYVGPNEPNVAWSLMKSVNPVAIDRDGTIYASNYAINPDGTFKHSYPGSVFAVAPGGTVYSWSSKTLYAMTANGRVKWSYEATADIKIYPTVSPTGIIYVVSTDGKLHAVSPNGIPIWVLETGSYSSPAIGADGTIYACGENKLYAIDPNSRVKWTFNLAFGFSSPAIGVDGTIYIDGDGKLYALTPDGSVRWTYKASDKDLSTPTIAADGTIYVGGRDGLLYALNLDGTLKWRFETELNYYLDVTVDANGKAYVGAEKLYVLNPDGTISWTYGSGRTSAPIIDADGTLYFGSADQLYALYRDNGIPPDLTISKITAIGVNAGAKVKVTAAVEERNGQPAHCMVSFYYNDKSNLIGIARTYVPPKSDYYTEPRYSYAQVEWYTQGMRPGTYRIIAVVEDVEPAESDTTNNEAETEHTLYWPIQRQIDAANAENADKLLFSIELKFQADLDRGNISDDLRQEFENHGISLSAQNVSVSIQEVGNKWSIIDQDNPKAYFFRKGGDKLNIYAGEIVLIEQGTYFEHITLKDGVIVKSKEGPRVTTIDGGGTGTVVNGEEMGDKAVLDGFTITNGSVGIHLYRASPTIRNNSIVRNGKGLGLMGLHQPLIERNLIAYNEVGVDAYFSGSTFMNNTIVYNTRVGVSGGSPKIINSILWGNGDDLRKDFGSPTARYSCIEDGDAGEGNIWDDPLFVDAFNDDYHLQKGSPCIDAGDPNSPLDPDGTRADMGAFPYVVPPHELTAPWDVNQDGVVDIFDLVLVGKHFGEQPPKDTRADVNGDGTVDIADIVIVAKHFGEKTNSSPASPPTFVASNPAKIWLASEKRQFDAQSQLLHVSVMADAATDLYGFQFDLAFPQEMLEVVSVSEGDLLGKGNDNAYWHAPQIDKQGGRITNVATTRVATDKGVSEGGMLATVAFKLKDAGLMLRGNIALENVKFVNSKGQLIPVSQKAFPLEVLIIPQRTELCQNYPNPFNPDTWIPYKLAESSKVTIRIYNVTGQLIREIELGHKDAGFYLSKERAAYWDGRNDAGERVASGVYFYQLQAGKFNATRKLVVLK